MEKQMFINVTRVNIEGEKKTQEGGLNCVSFFFVFS